jgi:hypothetical protein
MNVHDLKRIKMKKGNLILVNLMFSVMLYSQETKLIVRKFEGTTQIAEKYFVLKSDGKTKHGTYFLYFQLPEREYKAFKKDPQKMETYVKLKASYQEGKKHGDWEEYEQPFVLKAKGTYFKDQKIGIWQTVKEQGQVVENFDFDHQKQLPPLLNVFLQYPAYSREYNISGVVTITYKSNSDCTVSDLKITKSLSNDCDREVLRVITKLSELQKKYGIRCEDKIETKEFKFVLN